MEEKLKQKEAKSGFALLFLYCRSFTAEVLVDKHNQADKIAQTSVDLCTASLSEYCLFEH